MITDPADLASCPHRLVDPIGRDLGDQFGEQDLASGCVLDAVEELAGGKVAVGCRRLQKAQQVGGGQHPDLSHRGSMPGEAGIAGHPVSRPADDTDPPVPEVDEMSRQGPGAGEVGR